MITDRGIDKKIEGQWMVYVVWYTYVHIQCHLTTRPRETLPPTPAQSSEELYRKKITQKMIKF